ncbi:hypothetical protein E3N88_13391 [Mikania micrantha]|uniref:DYW domain-containing protein n=1 Tax=Mikania micrantha TaxID=192012 RepID=A0A5N6PA29_9ASTR|nr:hypothetical protein E3N88_13391 [Mikania micrantha]
MVPSTVVVHPPAAAATTVGLVVVRRHHHLLSTLAGSNTCTTKQPSSVISKHGRIGNLKNAEIIFSRIPIKNVISWTAMLTAYAENGQINKARELFDEMPERNVASWNAMISGYMRNKNGIDKACELFSMSPEKNAVSYASMITGYCRAVFEGCGRFDRYREGLQIHALVILLGFDFDTFLGNSVITMYCRLGDLDAAVRLFNIMEKKDTVSWNSLISGYIQAENIEEAYKHFNTMPFKDVYSWTTMITGFSNKGLTEKSVELFNIMPYKDDIVWTALISGFASNGKYEDSIHWFIQMLQTSVKPNALTFSSVLSSSASLAALNQGLQIHTHVLKTGMEFNLSVQNSLVSFYAKCGCVNDACKVFDSVNTPNVVSYNSMINGFAQNGHGKEAIDLFIKLKQSGIHPNDITFFGVLSACTHVGLVAEGRKYFNSMSSFYKIEPSLDHYACMVDLLGRAGFLDEAYDFLKSMPFEPHSGVWGALLGASRTHFRLDLAEIAAQHISELEPDNATPYVVLSDIYMASKKKENEELVRTMKKLKGLKKSPGCSWILVKGDVILFLSGDRSHRYFKEIKSTLWTLLDEM